MVKESNNKIRLTGSWLTEIGELDTAGKYFSHTYTHTTHAHYSAFFEYPGFMLGFTLFTFMQGAGKGDGADKGIWEPGIITPHDP